MMSILKNKTIIMLKNKDMQYRRWAISGWLQFKSFVTRVQFPRIFSLIVVWVKQILRNRSE